MTTFENQKNSPSKTKDDPFIGKLLGERYQILSLLGQGATTCVYKARDTKVGDLVAIKILHFQLRTNEMTVRRFDQEIKSTSLLKHVNIVSFRDSGTTDNDERYLVIEYVDGISLAQLIKEHGALEWRRTVQLFLQLCAALNAAHHAGIVHRDLKPANIMLTRDEQGKDLIKVLDFGVAKLLIQGETFQTKTQTGEMLGTLLYMSPEQCLDQDLDGRSDIYSLGCVLVEALTGTPPFSARTAFETMNLHLTGTPDRLVRMRPDLDLPKYLDHIIQTALEKNQSRRYQTVNALAQDLMKVLSNETGSLTLAASPVQKAENRAVSVSNDNDVISKIPLWLIVLCLFSYTPTIIMPSVVRLEYTIIWGVTISACFIAYLGIKAMREPRVPMSEQIIANWRGRANLTNKVQEAVKIFGQPKISVQAKNTLINEFAFEIFNLIDLNKDGFITEDEIKRTLENHSVRLTPQQKSFITFVLQNYSELREIFDEDGKSVGISNDELLEFAHNANQEELLLKISTGSKS